MHGGLKLEEVRTPQIVLTGLKAGVTFWDESFKSVPVAPELRNDADTFQNYPNVEASNVTEEELSAHWEKGHIIGFESYEELSEFVQGIPILSKLG